MNLLELKHISYRYPLSKDPVIEDLNLKVEQGEILGVIGANGAGKTTLCNIIRGFIPAFYRGELKGEVLFEGKELNISNLGALANKIGYVFQNPFTQISGVKYSVFDEIAYGLENLAVPRSEMKIRVQKIIDLLHLQKIVNKNPYDLSGGQKQMVALASILVLEPELIILDEPTSQLDPAATAQVYKVVDLLKKQHVTVIIVDHKTDLLAKCCDRIAVMNDGQIGLEGPTHEVFAKPEVLQMGGQLPQIARFFLAKKIDLKGQPMPITVDEAMDYFKGAAK